MIFSDLIMISWGFTIQSWWINFSPGLLMLGNIRGISSGITGTAIYQAIYHGIGFQGVFVHGFSWLNSLLPGLGRWVKTMM